MRAVLIFQHWCIISVNFHCLRFVLWIWLQPSGTSIFQLLWVHSLLECHRLNPWHSSSQDSKNWSIIPQRIIATHFSIAVAKQPQIWSNVYKDKLTHHLTEPENCKLKPLVKLSEASDLTRLTVQTWNELKPRVHLSWMQISNLASLLKKSMVKFLKLHNS